MGAGFSTGGAAQSTCRTPSSQACLWSRDAPSTLTASSAVTAFSQGSAFLQGKGTVT